MSGSWVDDIVRAVANGMPRSVADRAASDLTDEERTELGVRLGDLPGRSGYPPQSGGPSDAIPPAGGLAEELRQERLRHQMAEREVADLRADVERLRADRSGWESLTASVTHSLDVERTTVQRLRELLAEATAGWIRTDSICADEYHRDPDPRPVEIRDEEGLS